MCKIGDIIRVEKYVHNGIEVDRHSFIVLEVDNGEIHGLEYDIIGNAFSSFKDEEQKIKKLRYPANFPIFHYETNVVNGNRKDGYIKTDQLYYFKLDKIQFKIIGNVNIDAYKRLVEFIKSLEIDFELIVDNL